MISAQIIADSVSTSGVRLTTFVVNYHRFILSEINTHRQLSKNSASSRARPSKYVITQAIENPAWPVEWGTNKPGMQAGPPLSPEQEEEARTIWYDMIKYNAVGVQKLLDLGIHKQVANRPLEWAIYNQSLITATEWDNFFNLRAHSDAQPEFRELAKSMKTAYVESTPKVVYNGWHLPFITKADKELPLEMQKICSVARCARVSYKNHDGSPANIEKDIQTHDRLFKNGHLSPFEHIAVPMETNEFIGPFKGWKQMRKFIVNEENILGNKNG